MMGDREKYKIDLNFCPTPIILVAANGKIVRTNKRLESLFGYEKDELIGCSVEVLVPEDRRSIHPTLRNAYFDFPTPRQMGTGRELHGVCKNGDMIPVEIGLDPIEFDGDRMVMVSVLDIRERKSIEAMIRRAMDAACSAMIQVDGSGRIEFVNQQAASLFGYDNDELLGMSIEELMPKQHRIQHKVYRASYQQAREKRRMRGGPNLVGLRKDGSEFPAEIGLTPILENNNDSVMATIIDVTDRQEYERQIQDSNERLKVLNGELTEFAYSASHDLKAPLTSITGLLDCCGSDLEKHDYREVLRNVQRARTLTDRLSKRIEDMLSLARADEVSNDRVVVDVASVVDDVWSVLNSNGVELTTTFQHAEPFCCVETRFSAILENLLSNAVKYRSPNKKNKFVRIETWSEEDCFTMTVTDNGIGIPSEHQHKVFGLFQRVANNKEPGSGLGLALVRKHVTSLQGTIALESNEQQTVLKVVLPQVVSGKLAMVSEGVA